MSGKNLLFELKDSKDSLSSVFYYSIKSLAYPYEYYNT